MLVVINHNSILIADNGRKLIIDVGNPLFNILKDKNKEEIKEWYLKGR